MRVNFTNNDIDKLLDSDEIETLKKANPAESNNENYSDPYSDEPYDALDGDESSSNKKLFMIIGVSIAVIIIGYFGITFFSSDSEPEPDKKVVQKTDSVKTPIKVPAFSADELTRIATKQTIINAFNTLFNINENGLIIDLIQVRNNTITVQFISSDRGKIAKALKKFDSSENVETTSTTESKELGGSNQIRTTVEGKISLSAPVASNLVKQGFQNEQSLRSTIASNNLKLKEVNSLTSNSFLIIASGTKKNIQNYISSYISSLGNTSFDKITIVNNDRGSLSNKNFTINQRILTHFPK